MLLDLLEERMEITHQMFKGALHLLTAEPRCFVYSWEDALAIMPAVIEAQHSDKESVVELLKDFYYKTSRTFTDFCLGTMHIFKPGQDGTGKLLTYTLAHKVRV